MKGLFIALIKGTETLQRRGDGYLCAFREFTEELWTIFFSQDTLAGVDDWFSSDVDEICDAVDGGFEDLLSVLGGEGGGCRWDTGDGGSRGDGLSENASCHVFWEIDEDGSRSSARGNFKSL